MDVLRCLQFQFLFVLMPQQREDVYSMIKKPSISEIPSQCCLTKFVQKIAWQINCKLTKFVQKIAWQINCKLGGALWSLKLPFVCKFLLVFLLISVFDN